MSSAAKFALVLSAVLLSSTPAKALSTPATPTIEWHVTHAFAMFDWLGLSAGQEQHWTPKSAMGSGHNIEDWYVRTMSPGAATGYGQSRVPARGQVGVDYESSPYGQFALHLISNQEPETWASPRHHFPYYKGQYEQAYAQPAQTNLTFTLTGFSGTCHLAVSDGSGTYDGPCDLSQMIVPVTLDVGQRFTHRRISLTDSVGHSLATEIQIEHLTIVGLGDSYAAGEGNPDVPTQWSQTFRANPSHNGHAPRRNAWDWIESAQKLDPIVVRRGAIWEDSQCNRSFWNYQELVALQIASDSPHRLVTFLHYACTGAEIFGGMLVRQNAPAGSPATCDESGSDENCRVHRSQLASAVLDLCRPSGSTSVDAANGSFEDASLQALLRIRGTSGPYSQLESYKLAKQKDGHGLDLVQCKGKMIKPDLVLLSIGGNDIGFAPLIRWTLIPSKTYRHLGLFKFNRIWRLLARDPNVYCPRVNGSTIDGKACKRYVDRYIDTLPLRMAVLKHALSQYLEVMPESVVQPNYPDPFRRVAGAQLANIYHPDPALFCQEKEKVDYGNGWDGLRGIVTSVTQGFLNLRNWEVDVTPAEAGFDYATLENFRDTLRRAARGSEVGTGFTFVDQARDAFIGHGFCEHDNNTDLMAGAPISLPTTPFEVRVPDWAPDRPDDCAVRLDCWHPFAPMRRSVRTINDSIRTQTSGNGDQLAGVFHPTAQGQAQIADVVVPVARRVIGLQLSPGD